MGVPKFYRWLSERYPCLSEVVKEYQIPEFDNLYLDMNGIIHLCSHPNDDDPKFRITEEKIMKDISHYIEALFRLIKPKKVFFMAVDGVAPRAKMNQQRGRRFRSAREASESEQRAVQRGEVLPSEERFDSNCITPGTPFMARLQQHLKYFISKKISTDRAWHGIRIYLSGHNTPGEGEHKIMDFIRSEKVRRDYDPNTRHCLYGLDADLIMLGMCTHDPNFSLLREEVRFTGKKTQKRTPTVEETTFHLLHLSLLRDYLDHEFSPLKNKLHFDYNLEKIVDDWVMMGFLVGNDFIPNLPHLHIVSGALPRLYQTYIQVLPALDGYINENGYLNLKRFEIYMEKLAQVDYDHFDEFFTDFKWLESKKSSNEETWTSKKVNTKKQLEALRLATEKSLIDFGDENEDETDSGTLADNEFQQNKRDYYTSKLNFAQVTDEVLSEQAECYVRAIQWTLHYYYNGVCSWSWYYPHHYAPFVSDIRNFSHMKLDYELSKPFLPFQQLLAVLPAASKQFLPKPYQGLMCDQNSSLIQYYPLNFETDLNGKQQDWEAVVLLPFIDEKQLLEAMKPLSSQLTDEEHARNSHGPCLLFTDSKQPLGCYPSYWPAVFPHIDVNWAKCEEIPIDAFRVSQDRLKRGLCKSINLDLYFLGFPNLRRISHKAYLKKAEVRVFQQNSRGENMILEIEKQMESSARRVMEEFSDGIVYTSWPHLCEAKVVAVSDVQNKFVRSADNQIQVLEMNKNEVNAWHMEAASIKERYYKRWGIDVGEIKILVHTNQLIGSKKVITKNGVVSEEKQYSKQTHSFALQATVKDIQLLTSLEPVEALTVEKLFPLQAPCFLLTPGENYGCQAEVKAVVANAKKGVSIQVQILEAAPDPELQIVRNAYQSCMEEYLSARSACQRLGISCHMLSRITSMLHISCGEQKVNIGLNMKSVKRDEEMSGYTRKTNEGWLYSRKAIETVETYLARFPELFDFLSCHPSTSEMLQEEDLLINCPNISLSEVQSFLKSLPSSSLSCCPCGSQFLPEDLVVLLEDLTNKCSLNKQTTSSKTLHVRPHLLHVPSNVVALSGDLQPDPTSSIFLLDRVVYVTESGSVPLGLRGVVIGVVAADNEVYEVLFDSAFEGTYAVRGSSSRVYRLQSAHLISLTHGARQSRNEMDQSGRKAAVSLNVANNNQVKAAATRIVRRERNQVMKQTGVVSGGQPPTRSAGLNHSPNSPFVPSKPYFYTPTMPSTGPPTTTNRDIEFQEMWKQLQSSNKSARVNPAGGGGGSPALIQAAKSLPKHESGVIGCSAPQMIKKGTGVPGQKPPFQQSQEFSVLLKALEHQVASPRTNSRPVENLLRHLSLNDTAVSEPPMPPIRVGQSISLEELFKSPSTEPQQQPRRVEPTQPPVVNHVMTLMTMSQQLLRGVPMYNYHVTAEKLFIAHVSLPNGLSTRSQPCKSQQEAAECAAQLAKQELANLNRLDGQPKVQLRGPLVMAAPPAYVQPYLVGSSGAHMMRPPLMFHPAAQTIHHRPPQQQQQQLYHQVRGQRAQYPVIVRQQQPLAPRNQRNSAAQNPFVPLQVTKQSKSVRGVSCSSAVDAGGSGVASGVQKADPSANRAQTVESLQCPSSDDLKTKKQRTTKKKQSKLAINFTAVN